MQQHALWTMCCYACWKDLKCKSKDLPFKYLVELNHKDGFPTSKSQHANDSLVCKALWLILKYCKKLKKKKLVLTSFWFGVQELSFIFLTRWQNRIPATQKRIWWHLFRNLDTRHRTTVLNRTQDRGWSKSTPLRMTFLKMLTAIRLPF